MTRFHRRLGALLAVAATSLAVGVFSAPASAEWGIHADEFGIESFDGQFVDSNGNPYTQAGGHPYAFVTRLMLKHHIDQTPGYVGRKTPNGQPKNIAVELPPGFLGNATVTARCTAAQLAGGPQAVLTGPECPTDSIVGQVALNNNEGAGMPNPAYSTIFNMVPPVGIAARFGFNVLGTPIVLDASVRPDGQIVAASRLIPQSLRIYGVTTVFWGTPADPAHDEQRCAAPVVEREEIGIVQQFCDAGASGPSGLPNATAQSKLALLTMPTSCTPPGMGLETKASTDSWFDPGVVHTASFFSHRLPMLPDPQGAQIGTTACDRVPLDPALSLQPTNQSAGGPSGLDVKLEIPSDGLFNPKGISQAQLKKVTVALPEGMTINPSQAEGLGVCSTAQYGQESIDARLGEGCPSTSKIGTVSVQTPLLDESLEGTVYVGQPDDPTTPALGAENPFDSLLALYIVIEQPERGVLVKMAAKVELDERTGRILTTFDNLPKVAFSRFDFRFREGPRSPLVTPSTCGTHTTQAVFVPWSAEDPDNPTPAEVRHAEVPFTIGSGCPSGGTPRFRPDLNAGTINNNAGSYSPFYIRLSRNDGEQEFTNFSIKLPPGIVGKLAGVPLCPDAAIAAAKLKTGTAEISSPSCPKASEVGRTLVGAGVGSALTYVPGKVYLAGPYHGSSLSIAAITSAKVGPFDVGTVVIRQALKVDPETAEVFIDATGSDPIPHIIEGIPVHARDIRVYVDRPEFVLNPTSCERTSTAATVLGSGLDFSSLADDQPKTAISPFQAANCASLGFRPRLALSLLGGTERGDNPKLKAVLTARRGDANIGEAQVTLPRSEFLDNKHIKTICTRVQFNEGVTPGEKCPRASIYGFAKAVTPILDEPLQGPVFLRSSTHKLPDLVAALSSGTIDITLVGRIDSIAGGRIRSTFEAVPDAPVTKFTLVMQGGKKGLLINSVNLCRKANRAISRFVGQNGKVYDTNPVLKPQCRKARQAKRR